MADKADNLTNKLATKAQGGPTPQQNFTTLLKAMQPQIERALPKHISGDRMARIALTAYNSSPAMREASPMSILAAVLTSAQLGLEINTPLGQAYIIPYRVKGEMRANFQIGYKGILDLCYRTGEYQVIYAMEVYANDHFDYEFGLEPKLKHIPAKTPEGEPIYYYAVYRTKNGGQDFRVWSREKIKLHAQHYSQAFRAKKQDSPWYTAFDAMAKKTVLLNLLAYAPKSIELARAMESEGTTGVGITPEGEVQTEYIDLDFDIATGEATPKETDTTAPVEDQQEKPTQ